MKAGTSRKCALKGEQMKEKEQWGIVQSRFNSAFTFQVTEKTDERETFREIMRIEPDGKFYVNGRLVETDREVYEGMKQWLIESNYYPGARVSIDDDGKWKVGKDSLEMNPESAPNHTIIAIQDEEKSEC